MKAKLCFIALFVSLQIINAQTPTPAQSKSILEKAGNIIDRDISLIDGFRKKTSPTNPIQQTQTTQTGLVKVPPQPNTQIHRDTNANPIAEVSPKIYKRDGGEAAQQLILQDSTLVIIDTRPEFEFKQGHLKNAICYDSNSAYFHSNLNGLDRKKNILLCNSRIRTSVSALMAMRDAMGFNRSKLFILDLNDWIRLGFKIEK